MQTGEVAVTDLDSGVLARIDRKLVADFGQDETWQMVRVPATPRCATPAADVVAEAPTLSSVVPQIGDLADVLFD